MLVPLLALLYPDEIELCTREHEYLNSVVNVQPNDMGTKSEATFLSHLPLLLMQDKLLHEYGPHNGGRGAYDTTGVAKPRPRPR